MYFALARRQTQSLSQVTRRPNKNCKNGEQLRKKRTPLFSKPYLKLSKGRRPKTSGTFSGAKTIQTPPPWPLRSVS